MAALEGDRDRHRRRGADLLVDAMSEKIKSVQRLVGADPDGIRGPKTCAAMGPMSEDELLHPWSPGAPLKYTADRGNRVVHYLVVHHSDTHTVDGMVRALNAAPKKNKSTHYSVDKDGTIREHVNPWEQVTWHCVGANLHGIGIDLIHKGKDPFPPAQLEALGRLLRWLCKAFDVPQVLLEGRHKIPAGTQLGKQSWGICGHGQLQATACPGGAPLAEVLRAAG